MKGCARSCLIGLAVFAVAIGVFHYWLRGYGVAHEVTLPVSVAAAFFGTVSVSFLWSIRSLLRERGLLRNAVAGTPPEDGKLAAISGVIHATSPITSPISAKNAVAFKYDMYEMRRSGKNSHKISHYEGTVLAASTISTNIGTFRLLAVPTFDVPQSDFDQDTAIRNAMAYIEATEFETGDTPKEQRQNLEKEWTDDDGVFRKDKKGTDEVDLAACRFDEQIVPQDAQVCVVGLYSQMRGGIIPHPNWGKHTKLILGDGEAGIQRLGSSAVKYFIGAIITGAISAGICWMYIHRAIPPG